MKKYNVVDLTKLVLSYFVIGIHTRILNQDLLPLFRIAVPVFFIYSSYFFFCKKKPDIKKTVLRNIKLYIFWFVVLLPVTVMARKYFESGLLIGIISIIKDFFVGSTFLASWYISALTISLIIVYKIQKSKRATMILPCLMAFCFLLSLLTSNYNFLICNNKFVTQIIEFWLRYLGAPCNSFVVGIFWVGVGYYLSKIKITLKVKKLAICTIVSILGLFLEKNCISWLGINILSDESYILLIPAAIFGVLLTLNCKYRIRNSETYRKLSTFNYCLHFSVAVVIDDIIEYCHIWNPFNLLTFIITIVICYVLFRAVNILSKYKYFALLRYSM